MGTDATGARDLGAVVLGLEGFRLVAVDEHDGELELAVETTNDMVGCPGCGAVATAHGRRPVRGAGPAGRRSPDDADLDQAALAVLPSALRDQDLVGDQPGDPAASVTDDPGGAGGLPPGRSRR